MAFADEQARQIFERVFHVHGIDGGADARRIDRDRGGGGILDRGLGLSAGDENVLGLIVLGGESRGGEEGDGRDSS